MNDDELKAILEQLPAAKVQAIKDAYYKATEGLDSLFDELSQYSVELRAEYNHATNALYAMHQSKLGRVL